METNNGKVLSPQQRRFVRNWEEQRKGGKVGYLITFTLIGGFVIFIFISIVLFLFLRFTMSIELLYVAGAALLTSFIIVYSGWRYNESRYLKIRDSKLDI